MMFFLIVQITVITVPKCRPYVASCRTIRTFPVFLSNEEAPSLRHVRVFQRTKRKPFLCEPSFSASSGPQVCELPSQTQYLRDGAVYPRHWRAPDRLRILFCAKRKFVF